MPRNGAQGVKSSRERDENRYLAALTSTAGSKVGDTHTARAE